MTKNIFVRKKSDARETGQSGPAQFFLATVASVTAAEGVTIIPDGQTEAVAKKYKVLTDGTAPPAVGDRVVVMRHSGTCVILGAIGEPEDMDADARITDVENEITEIDTELGKKVAKAGDTMTGALTMNGADINLRSTTNTIGTVPASSVSDKRVYFRDKLNAIFGKLQSIFLNDGRIGLQLGAQRTVNGSLVENNLSLYVDASGNRTVTFTQIAAWRSALGLGTNGNLPITAAQGGTGAATAAGHAVFAGPNGTTAAAPSFRALVAADIPNLDASKITAGTLPIGRGGTGSTAVVTSDTISDIIAAASGFTITTAGYCAWGKVAMLYVVAKVTTATSSGWHTVGTVVSGKRPAMRLHASELNLGASSFLTTGVLQVFGTLAANQNLYLSATYLLA